MKSTEYVDKTAWLRYALMILYISLFELLHRCEHVLIKCSVTEYYQVAELQFYHHRGVGNMLGK